MPRGPASVFDGPGWLREKTPGFHFTSSSLPRAAYKFINGIEAQRNFDAADSASATSGAGRGFKRAAGRRATGQRGGGSSTFARAAAPADYSHFSPDELAQLHADLERELTDVEAARAVAEAAAKRRSANAARAKREAELAARKRSMVIAEEQAAKAAAELMAKSERLALKRLDEARARVEELKAMLKSARAARQRPHAEQTTSPG